MNTELIVISEFPERPEENAAYIKEEKDGYHEFIYRDGVWEWLGKLENSWDEIKEPPKMRPTNCTNCGAPLKNGKCAYCGTEY